MIGLVAEKILAFKSEEEEDLSKKNLLEEIIRNKKITTLFQPIVDVTEQRIIGYEALSRGPEGSIFESPLNLFEAARQYNLLWDLEYCCRYSAITKFKELGLKGKLFLNVDPAVVCYPLFKSGITMEIVKQCSLNPEDIVMEITEASTVSDIGEFVEALKHYRSQGYKVAIDDLGSGNSGIRLILALRPDYIKVDKSIISMVHQDSFKENMCKIILELGKLSDIKIIAEGIENEEELRKLTEIGYNFFQGYFFLHPQKNPVCIKESSRMAIKKILKSFKKGVFSITSFPIGQIARRDKPVSPEITALEAKKLFSKYNTTGLVVVENEKVVGLLMKQQFDSILARPFGNDLFLRRPIRLIMNPSPLVLDYNTPIMQASQLAMSRSEENLYDYIVVTKDDKYYGVVSVKRLLDQTTMLQLNYVKHLNPLTGLPGNVLIENKIKELIESSSEAAVIYVDLNNFKKVNDNYGFKKGDEAITCTAECIKNVFPKFFGENVFLGHIGGDDFVVITTNTDIALLEQAFKEFISVLEKEESYLFLNGFECDGSKKGGILTAAIACIVGNLSKLGSADAVSYAASCIKKECKDLCKAEDINKSVFLIRKVEEVVS